MGVYSPNMLAHFPEQFRMFTYFNMDPKINSGYTVSTPASYWGILQNDTSFVKDGNGNLVEVNHENLWTDQKLIRGFFIEFDAVNYRIVDGSDWPHEGGFYHYTLDRQVGDNGTPDPQVWSFGGTPV
jgi:hypothetical protein